MESGKESQSMIYDIRADEILQTIYQNPPSNDIHFEETGLRLFDVETPGGSYKESTMSATTDKDYIDARLKAMSDSLDQRLETAAAKSDGRLEVIETRMDARMAALDAKLATGIAAMDAKLDANFARFESMLHKSSADIHKATTDTLSRVVAIVSGLVGIGIAVIVLVLNNMAPKPAPIAPAPVVIYAQPAATAPPQVAPVAGAKQ